MSTSSALPARRSLLVTLLGWLVILGSAALSVISFFAFLMVLAGGDGTQSTTLSGFLLVVVAPPVSLVAGIGLLRRWRWSWVYLVAGLLLAIGWQVVEGMSPAKPAVTTTTLPSGVKNTVYHSGSQFSVPLTAVLGGLLVVALTPGVRREFGITRKSLPPPVPDLPRTPKTDNRAMENQRGWRVGHQGRDMMVYEEKLDGEWKRISIDGEMLMGRAHHVIYFADEKTWQGYPEWASHRRDEIMARIKSEFREPDYEYDGGGTVGRERENPPSGRTGAAAIPAKDGSILPMLLFLAVIAAASSWFTWQGIKSGETRLPIKHGHSKSVVTKAEDPALFWTSITLTGTLGAGCLFFAVWLIRNRQPRG